MMTARSIPIPIQKSVYPAMRFMSAPETSFLQYMQLPFVLPHYSEKISSTASAAAFVSSSE